MSSWMWVKAALDLEHLKLDKPQDAVWKSLSSALRQEG